MNFILRILKSIIRRYNRASVYLSNKFRVFLFGTQDWESYHQWLILTNAYKLYSSDSKSSRKLLVNMTEATAFSGLADRFRCFISCYIIAKENNLRFFIFHDKGFLLERYLEPSRVDWTISENYICKGLNNVKLLWLTELLPRKGYFSVCSFFPLFKTINGWPGKLSSAEKEYHAYGILDIIPLLPSEIQDKYTFKGVFDTLFLPSSYLQNLLSKALSSQQLEENQYIAIHLRFLNFFEPVEPYQSEENVIGTPEQQAQMIANVHATIESIHRECHCDTILLFSDSNRFLNHPHPAYVKVLPGTVGHIVRNNGTDDITDKAFTDFFVMARARKVYSITGTHIYGGSFARTAAAIGGKEYYTVPLVTSDQDLQ